MSQKLQPVRGTHDILPEEFEKFYAVISRARELATLYGFREMATPIFEATEVFSRSMGETSDVVSKEMFSFDTKGGESVTLRPEFTAGIARAFISNGMQQHLPLKLFSTGPLFRYERPQKGRQRQFHQVNFEWLGDNSAEADVEMILLAAHLLYSLSGNKGCTLHINTLGDVDSRAAYREALVGYLAPFSGKLSDDSKRRLSENPLRILDSKSPEDRKILENAPVMTDYLSESARTRFDSICTSLKSPQIPLFQNIKIDPSLVRGLDYYTDTVFEFVANTGELGAQNTVLAGGRYDGLIEHMGGKPTSAVGFAAGVERLLLLTAESKLEDVNEIRVVVLPFEGLTSEGTHLLATLIRGNLSEILRQSLIRKQAVVEVYWQGKLKKRLEKAAQRNASHVIIIAPEEAETGMCIVRDMKTRIEKKVPADDFKDPHKIKSIFNVTG